MTSMHSLRRLPALLSFLLGVALCTTASAAAYKAKAIGSVAPGDCYHNDLNASGQVVGACFEADGVSYSAYVTDAKGKGIRKVGLLTGDWSWTNGLNDGGVLVGDATLAGNEVSHAWVQQPGGAMQDLGTLGGANSYALNVNNSGLIAGGSQFDASDKFHGFVVYPGTTTLVDIGSLGGTSFMPWVVSSNGVIGGLGDLAGDLETRGFYSKPPYTSLVVLDSLGGKRSNVKGINASGVIVGYSSLADNVMSRAFVGKVGSKKVTELAVPAGKSGAYAINKLGVIVGRYTRASDGKYSPFSCSGACADFLDLNTVTTGLPAGVELRSALAINDKGMVTAQGSDNRIYLLLPQ